MILHLTAGFGDGHNTAARNVAAGLARLAPDEPTRIVDLCDAAHPLLSPLVKAGYQMMITRIPWLWGKFFQRTAEQKIDRRTDWVAGSFEPALDELLRRERPRGIVCTYLLFQGVLQNLREKGRILPPIFTVITDSITIHPLWLLGPSDRYYVADDDSRAGLAGRGVNERDIVVSGFPVNLDFMDTPHDPPPSRAGRILYLPSTGERHVRRTLESLASAAGRTARTSRSRWASTTAASTTSSRASRTPCPGPRSRCWDGRRRFRGCCRRTIW